MTDSILYNLPKILMKFTFRIIVGIKQGNDTDKIIRQSQNTVDKFEKQGCVSISG